MHKLLEVFGGSRFTLSPVPVILVKYSLVKTFPTPGTHRKIRQPSIFRESYEVVRQQAVRMSLSRTPEHIEKKFNEIYASLRDKVSLLNGSTGESKKYEYVRFSSLF